MSHVQLLVATRPIELALVKGGPPSPPIGRFSDKETSVLNTTTTSDPGSLHHTYDFSIEETGTYAIRVHYQWSCNSTNHSFVGRAFLDALPIGLNDNGRGHQQVPANAGGMDGGTGSGTDQRFLDTIEDVVVIETATNPHTLELWVSGAGGAGAIIKTVYGSVFVIERLL